jgi:hypothetical protein
MTYNTSLEKNYRKRIASTQLSGCIIASDSRNEGRKLSKARIMRTLMNIGKRVAIRRTRGGLLMLVLFLFLEASAISPALHSLVCPKAGQPDDDCAVACFAAGLVESPPVAANLGSPSLMCRWITIQWREETHPSSPLFRLSPSRAPPG